MEDLQSPELNKKISIDLGSVYKSRSPKNTILHQVVTEHFQKFLGSLNSDPDQNIITSIPDHVEAEFDSYLKCGILEHGFVKMSCTDCKATLLVPFSCKKRGFCPSCIGKRMNEGASFFVSSVIPKSPVRQWVLSFPMPARFWMARNPELMGSLLNIFIRAVRGYYRDSFIKHSGIKVSEYKIQTGALTVIQRFGGGLNLNIHFHTLFLDGVYVSKVEDSENKPTLVQALPMRNEEIEKVLKTIQKRMVRHLIKRDLLSKYENDPIPDQIEEPTLLDSLQSASVQNKIGSGENRGNRVRRVGSFGTENEQAFKAGNLSAVLGGFSFHAGTFIQENDRERLENLCKYLLRPPISDKRLRRVNNGDVQVELKSEWSDGTRALCFTPHEFIEKMISIIPPPRIHGVRFHGILAPSATDRKKIVPAIIEVPAQGELFCERKKSKIKRTSWAELLERTFQIDLSICIICGGAMKFKSAVLKKSEILDTLNAAGLSPTPE